MLFSGGKDSIIIGAILIYSAIADYVLNQRLNIKAFYDKVITNPFISTTFPGSITNAGFSLRFTLAG